MKKLKLQTKSLTVDDAGIITGIAWPFGEPDSYGDVIKAGAFQIRSHVPMLWDHDHGQPIGIWESIKETERGLEVRGRLLIDEVERAAEVFALIKSGAIRGLSIGFWPIEAERNKSGGEDISALDLIEISCVSIPAHPKATITSAKSAKRGKGTILKTALKKTNVKAIEDELPVDGEGEDADLDGRVTALETEVAEIKELVTGTSESVEEMAKSLKTLVTKSGRPAPTILRTPEKPEEAARKAFVSYLRHGDKSPETKALRSSIDGKGGYVIPPEFANELIEEVIELNPIRQLAKVGKTGSNAVIIPGANGQTNAQWVGELEDSPESDTSFGQYEIPIHELATYIDVPNATLADSALDLESHIRSLFATDIATKESQAFIFGDGVKKPEGFMTRQDITQVNSGGATSITADSLYNLVFELQATFRKNGAFAMNGKTIRDIMKLKDGQGNYLWQMGDITKGQQSTILGFPVFEMPDMPAVAAGSNPIMFGDWSGFRIYDRLEMEMLIDPYSASKKRMTSFHITHRVGAGIVEPKKFARLVITA